MAEVGGASPDPALTPVEVRGRGPSARVALGLITAVLVALVGIALVGQSRGGPGPQAAVDGSTATPVASPSTATTATPEPSPGTPPPRAAVSVGPVPTCPPGSSPDKAGPVDQARPPFLYGPAMAFDRRAGRLIAVTGDAYGLAPETWTFDVCTNT